MPDFGVIMPVKELVLGDKIQDLVVNIPNRLNFYGVFIPCRNF
jgi:hypothetical protein